MSLTLCNFGNTWAIRVIFFFKRSKIWCRFPKWKKNSTKWFNFSDNCIWTRSFKFEILPRKYLSSPVNVSTKSYKFSNITSNRSFVSQSPSDIQNNSMKVLSWKFHKCFGPSNMLAVEWCCETGLFRHLGNHAFYNM